MKIDCRSVHRILGFSFHEHTGSYRTNYSCFDLPLDLLPLQAQAPCLHRTRRPFQNIPSVREIKRALPRRKNSCCRIIQRYTRTRNEPLHRMYAWIIRLSFAMFMKLTLVVVQLSVNESPETRSRQACPKHEPGAGYKCS